MSYLVLCSFKHTSQSCQCIVFMNTLFRKMITVFCFQTKLLCQYVLQLAKYDQNYDVRDRARFVKALLFPSDSEEVCPSLHSLAFFSHVMISLCY